MGGAAGAMALALAAGASSVLGGCHVNMSSFNGDMPREEFAARVRERFPLGASSDQIEARLKQSNLRFWRPEYTIDERLKNVPVIDATIEPRKPYVSFYSGASGALSFWFDKQGGLQGVAYQELATWPVAGQQKIELIAGEWPGGGA